MPVPTVINVTRIRSDTCAERFYIGAAVTGATFALNVEGLGALTGSIVTDSATQSVVDFAVSVTAVSGGAAAAYDYDVVMTLSGTTRTLIQGTWTIESRRVS